MDTLQGFKNNDRVKKITNVLIVYFGWIFIHYTASHLYVKMCVPSTIMGFIMAPFIVPSPHCQALRWAIYNGGNSIMAMWIVLGTIIMRYLKPIG
uniref:Uncharacterized protein n=1 Tax=viral metagenome TaxID=1070528 RepID=A0A6C0CRL5_9ZZZZ